MSSQHVILLEIGQPTWRRWMIFHREKKRYWCNTWKKRRRNGELWAIKTEAERELAVARSSAEAN